MIKQLTFTRFLAAVSVVIFHFGQKAFPFDRSGLDFIFKQAFVCVSYFFVLSGFVMIAAYGKHKTINAGQYLTGRFARIFPVYILAILMVLAAQVWSREMNFRGLWLNILMIQAWVPSEALTFNPPGWTISVELLFYLSFPLLFSKIYKKKNSKTTIVFGVLLWVVSQIVFHWLTYFYLGDNNPTNDKFANFNPILHLNEFVVGNLAGLFYMKKFKGNEKSLDWLVVFLVIALVLVLKSHSGLNFHNGLLALIFVPLILSLSVNNGIITKISSHRYCIFLGEISYGIYILQYPIFGIVSASSLRKYFHIEDVTMAFYVRMVLLIVFSALCYKYLETPLRERIRKIKFVKNTAES